MSGCGAYLGISKYYSNQDRDKSRDGHWIGSSLFLISLSSLLIIFLLLIFKEYISINIFNNFIYSKYIIYSLIITTPIIGVSSIAIGVINGLQHDYYYYSSILIGSILGLIGSIILIYINSQNGVVISIIMTGLCQAILIIVFSLKFVKLKKIYVNKKIIKDLFNYGSLAIFAGLIIPIASIAIRTYVKDISGDFDMGIYQALIRLSESYTQLPMILLSSYYYPRFSNNKNIPIDLKFFKNSFASLLVLMIAISVFLLLFKNFIIEIIFTKEFYIVENYLITQIIGDVLKIFSFFMATVLMARGHIKICNIGTLVHVLILLIISYVLIAEIGLYGAILANMLTYGIYFLLSVYTICKLENLKLGYQK